MNELKEKQYTYKALSFYKRDFENDFNDFIKERPNYE